MSIKQFRVLLVLAAMFGNPGMALAWHGPGHMAVAVIAYHQLGRARAHRVADILRKHPDYGLWMNEKPDALDEDEYLLMRASVWPDDIRSRDHPSHAFHQGTWHYFDKFIRVPPDQPEPAPEPGMHIIEALNQNSTLLATSTDPADRARAVCWMAHLIGDIQQPLHAVALVSPQFPTGDRGGNSLWVTSSEGPTNLHSFWDGIWDRETALNGGAAKKLSELTAADTELTRVEPLALSIAAKVPRSALPELARKDFPSWLDESFTIANNRGYLGGKLKGGTSAADAPPLPVSYETNARTIGERRLALGGYRLADRLVELLHL